MNNLDNLRQMSQWVCWDRETRNGKTTKIPKDPHTGDNAQSNNPSTWGTYQQAQYAKTKRNHSGIGIMFYGGLCGIDIDGEKDNIQQAQVITKMMNSYTELSPSGNGRHILFTVNLNKLAEAGIIINGKTSPQYYQKNPNNHVECYLSGITNRYFTVTEKPILDMPITDRTEQLIEFMDKFMRKPQQTSPNPKKTLVRGLNDSDIIKIAEKAKNGDKFKRLMQGNLSDYNNDHSGADLGLCSILAFYCKGDYSQIDRIFRSSGLYRNKWDREDYRTATINKAIAQCNNSYYAPKPKVTGSSDEPSAESSENKKRPPISIQTVAETLEKMKISVRYNVITSKKEFDGCSASWVDGEEISLLPVFLYNYFKLKNEFSGVTKAVITDFLHYITLNQSYNPVLDMCRTTRWDGNDRFSECCSILGVADDLSKLLIQKWLWQCISMAHNTLKNPYGADGVLVFQGEQGVGKTSFFRTICPWSGLFKESCRLSEEKDAIIKATSVWICELGELDTTTKRKDSGFIKAFVTENADKYRKPYAAEESFHPRRTSYCASVNIDEFLRDETGNRRFWTIPITKIDLNRLNAIDKDINWKFQFWAQVYTWYHTNPQGFRLTPDERKQLEQRNNTEYTDSKSGEGFLLEALDFNMPKDLWSWVSPAMLSASLIMQYAHITDKEAGHLLTAIKTKHPQIDKMRKKTGRYYLLPISNVNLLNSRNIL